MAKQSVRMYMTPGSQARLRRLGKTRIMPELRKELRGATNAAVPALRVKIKSLPSEGHGGGKEGLRKQLARAVKRRMGLSVRRCYIAILVEPHGGLANLARAVEGTIPWKHPTYGNKPDVKQESMPFFYETLARLAPVVDGRVRRALFNFEKKV